jgi:hypothetical protein
LPNCFVDGCIGTSPLLTLVVVVVVVVVVAIVSAGAGAGIGAGAGAGSGAGAGAGAGAGSFETGMPLVVEGVPSLRTGIREREGSWALAAAAPTSVRAIAVPIARVVE